MGGLRAVFGHICSSLNEAEKSGYGCYPRTLMTSAHAGVEGTDTQLPVWNEIHELSARG